MTWEEVLRVTIPGQPVPKGRPRFRCRNNRVETYTDAKTKAFEELVALCVNTSPQLRGQKRPLVGRAPSAARIDITAVFQRPERISRKKDPDGLIPMGKRPDLDNVIKSVIDGCSIPPGMIWNDDGQVSCIRADAYYAEKDQGPRTEIVIYRLAR